MHVTVLLYVNDLVITSAKRSLVEAEKYKQVTFNSGDVHDNLGMVLTCRVRVSMIEYLKNLLPFIEAEERICVFI